MCTAALSFARRLHVSRIAHTPCASEESFVAPETGIGYTSIIQAFVVHVAAKCNAI